MESRELFSNHILALLDVINANGLGLWELTDNKVKLDQKISEIIGLEGSLQLNLDDLLKLIYEEDRQEIHDSLKLIKKDPGQRVMAECRILNQKEKNFYWVRILAKSYLNQGKKIILGSCQTIEGRALDVLNTMISDITNELNRKDQLNQCIHDITETLLNTDDTAFEESFQNCLEIIARAVGLSRVYIYKNHIVDGTLCCTEIHEWVNGVETTLGEEFTTDMPLHSWPGLSDILNDGKTYNRLITQIPIEIQEMIPKNTKVVLYAPIFLKDFLWGFVGYERITEQIFNVDEETALGSAGLLLANSLIRYDLNKNLYLAVDKINTTTIKAEVLEKFAYTDLLTGLYNRRHFMELAQNPMEKAKRHNNPCYAMMMDLDYFKKVNDSYGHLAGDEVLKNALRSYDLLARYGGEEFVVLVSEATRDAALTLAERIRESIAATPCIYNCIKIPCTISIGIAASFSDCTIESLIDKADKGLYKAKEAGRNQVVLFED